jgi:hypothetical protein
MSVAATPQPDAALNRAISDAIVELYAMFYRHDLRSTGGVRIEPDG